MLPPPPPWPQWCPLIDFASSSLPVDVKRHRGAAPVHFLTSHPSLLQALSVSIDRSCRGKTSSRNTCKHSRQEVEISGLQVFILLLFTSELKQEQHI
ncbi:hypothetical protein PBY51_006406 [Eleginops maclovinus]|uniref:Uncharacterized protein n=1 Tax=Eleginops maclovinus TaxID=56733 RepID=A0AAN8AA73_ELEMC|nr:hypothetical protein PBY51_006406 [Eleginops maclovinus]